MCKLSTRQISSIFLYIFYWNQGRSIIWNDQQPRSCVGMSLPVGFKTKVDSSLPAGHNDSQSYLYFVRYSMCPDKKPKKKTTQNWLITCSIRIYVCVTWCIFLWLVVWLFIKIRSRTENLMRQIKNQLNSIFVHVLY